MCCSLLLRRRAAIGRLPPLPRGARREHPAKSSFGRRLLRGIDFFSRPRKEDFIIIIILICVLLSVLLSVSLSVSLAVS